MTPKFSRPNGVMTNSHLGVSMGKDTKRERSQPAATLNYVALNKDEMAGLASTGKHCYPISGYLACVNCKNSYNNKLINDGQPEYECHHILLCQLEYEWCIPVHLLSIQNMNDNSWILVLVMWCDWCVCVCAHN